MFLNVKINKILKQKGDIYPSKSHAIICEQPLQLTVAARRIETGMGSVQILYYAVISYLKTYS